VIDEPNSEARQALCQLEEPDAAKERSRQNPERVMNSIIYLVGLIVVVLAILSFLGLR
jgi:hypothetical protein